MKRRKWVTAVLLLALANARGQKIAPAADGDYPSSGTESGKICGTVLDESGDPASNVHVIAMLLSRGGHTGGFPGTRADELGRYCIEKLPLGSYVLSADDEGLGYPTRGPSFFSWPSSDPQVTLSREKPDAKFDWKIPFRAGFLYLHLPAAQSTNDIVLMTINLEVRTRPSVGRYSISTYPEMGKSKELHVLLPPHEDVLLSVSGADNRSWPGDGKTKALNVLPGAIEDISIPSLKSEATR